MIDSRAYTEVSEIIKIMPREMKDKIPDILKQTIEYNKDKNYEFIIDEEHFDEIELLKDTEKILSVLYSDYFSTEEERRIILEKEKIIAQKKEISKNQKYPTDNIFSKNINNNIESKDLTTIQKEGIFSNIKNIIKNLIFRNKK